MERRTVFLASVGALSAVACGGEPEEAYGELQQAAITPTLRIKSISYTGTTPDSSLKLSVVVLAELYLGTITLIKGAPGAPTAGRLTKGAPKKPGLAEGRVSAELWDRILADSARFALTIDLRYTMTSATAGTFNEIFIGIV
ncbi:MAG TPA: hypothetical protein VHP33_24030 [Polyangiaceae bacterium]|nr:hypothetical protein [Polyangiaceae bacterium]